MRPYYSPGFDSSSNRNECHEYFLGSKGVRCLGLITLPPSCDKCLEIWEPQTSAVLRAWKRPAEVLLYLIFMYTRIYTFFFAMFFLKFVWNVAVFSSIGPWKLCMSYWPNLPFIFYFVLCLIFEETDVSEAGCASLFRQRKALTLVGLLDRSASTVWRRKPSRLMKFLDSSKISWWTKSKTKNTALLLQIPKNKWKVLLEYCKKIRERAIEH